MLPLSVLPRCYLRLLRAPPGDETTAQDTCGSRETVGEGFPRDTQIGLHGGHLGIVGECQAFGGTQTMHVFLSHLDQEDKK